MTHAHCYVRKGEALHYHTEQKKSMLEQVIYHYILKSKIDLNDFKFADLSIKPTVRATNNATAAITTATIDVQLLLPQQL